MRNVIRVSMILFAVWCLRAGSIPATSDEFVGPFPSWADLKTVYGAKGDGATDDTAAIQNALNALGTPGHSPVLYVPNGTYKITRTLNLAHAIDVSVIGQNPSSTSILWAGEAGGTMIYFNGVAYSKFTRLTFNGNSTALIAVDQSKADGTSNYFDTGNEYSDIYFKDVGYGIRGGAYGYGFAETSVERAHFVNNSVSGIAMLNYNALDLWVWYSTFEDCNLGVTNNVPGVGGAGNFHVYYSSFKDSAYADLAMGNTGGFSARGNYSIGSKWFFVNYGATNNPANIDIVGNIVLDPTSGQGVNLANQGPGLLMNNVFRTGPGSYTTTGPAVQWTTFSNDQDVESIGNTFTTANKIAIGAGELIEINDHVVASVNASAQSLPGTLPNLKRKTFEVAAGAAAAAIQSAVNQAFAHNGARPVVHIPYGTYGIGQTIVIPPSDIQIVGDGYGIGSSGTVLNWTGNGVGPVLLFNGPSKATLRDVGITGTADGIVVNNIDQAGARVYMDQAQLGGSSTNQSSFLAEGIANATVDLENMGVGGLFNVASGTVDVFNGSGGSTNSATTFAVSGGKLLVRDWWNDAGSGPSSTFAAVSGPAQFIADADEIYQSGAGSPAFSVNNLNGTASILTTDIGSSAGVSITGNGANTSVLGMGLLYRGTATYFSDGASPAGTAAMLNVRGPSMTPGNASQPLPNIGAINPAFITAMLAQASAQNPKVLNSLPASVSDVRFFRVAVSALNDMTLQGK